MWSFRNSGLTIILIWVKVQQSIENTDNACGKKLLKKKIKQQLGIFLYIVGVSMTRNKCNEYATHFIQDARIGVKMKVKVDRKNLSTSSDQSIEHKNQ